MNPIREQSSHKTPDAHLHQCEHCGAVISHVKSRIPPGGGLRAHDCPRCGKPINAVQLPPGTLPVDFADYYGPEVN